MKVFLLYYDRYDTATTSKALSIDHYVLCHSNKERFTCIGNSGTLVETGRPKGIQHNFNHGLDMLEDDEWGLFMSDDLIGAYRMINGKYEKCQVDFVLKQLMDALPLCDKMGVRLVGLSSSGNPFYAKNKYSKYGLVDGRCFAIKKGAFRFHESIASIPDYYATAWHLQKHGGNLILNHAFLDFKRYGDGGLGSIAERMPQKIADIRLMKQLFPNNVTVKTKPNHPPGSHIVIKR